MLDDLRTLGDWTPRRLGVAAATLVAYVLVVAVPTDLIDTPLFRRDVPPTWWAWPSLLLSGALVGLLVATYVADGTPRATGADDTSRSDAGQAAGADPGEGARSRRFGVFGSLLTFFAVGCPVCNKLVLLALGYAGALTWFEPLQPVLQAVAIGLLAWALLARLRGARACPAGPVGTASPTTSTPTPQEKS